MNTTTALSLTTAAATAIAIAAAAPAFARPFDGPFPNPAKHLTTRWDTTWAAQGAVTRVGTQITRCDTGEGNLGGAGAPAPATLPNITSCAPAAPTVPAVSRARQLEHDLLR